MNIKFLLRSNIKSASGVHNLQRILSRVPYNRKYLYRKNNVQPLIHVHFGHILIYNVLENFPIILQFCKNIPIAMSAKKKRYIISIFIDNGRANDISILNVKKHESPKFNKFDEIKYFYFGFDVIENVR